MTRVEQIGDATLYLGDCMDVLPTLPKVSAVITDPPYSSGGMVRGDRMTSTRVKYQSSTVETEHPEFTGDNRDQRGFVAWASLWLMYAMGITEQGGACLLFSDWRQLPSMTDAVQAGGWVWRGIVPWNKLDARPLPNRFRSQCEYVVFGTNGPRDFDMGPNAVYHPGILEERAPHVSQRQHTSQKPVGIMQTLCKAATPAGIVLDPFMGSGTTGIAALAEGRKFIGIEKSETYFDIACERIRRAVAQGRLFEPEPPKAEQGALL